MEIENIKKGNEYIYKYNGNEKTLQKLNGEICIHNHGYVGHDNWIGVIFECGAELIAYPEELCEIE